MGCVGCVLNSHPGPGEGKLENVTPPRGANGCAQPYPHRSIRICRGHQSACVDHTSGILT